MSGELIVKQSPLDMALADTIAWQCSFVPTYTPAPSEGTVYVFDVTGGEPGVDVSGTVLAVGAASASSGTITAPLMYGSACTALHRYRVSFIAYQGGQRCEQWLYLNMKA